MELLERFTRGDVAAFESLFRQFHPEVHRWIAKLVRDEAAAEDLTIETFLRIHRARARFDPARGFGAWARRIATNVAIDYLKSARHEVELPPDLSDTPLPQDDPELRDAIRRAFGQLPTRLRVPATLSLIDEQSNREIAAAMDISEAAVKSRVFRATRLLRQKLQRWGMQL